MTVFLGKDRTMDNVQNHNICTKAVYYLLYQPQMIDDGDCEAFCGMKSGRGNRSTRRKPAPAPLCPPQIPHVDPGSIPSRRSGKPATNRLSYGAALLSM
jgi:hypothetical protein